MKTIKCCKCGKENNWDADFCGSCGTKIKGIIAAEKTQSDLPAKKPDSINLIACVDCGKQISASARSCPGCGRPTFVALEEDKKTKRNKRGNTQGMGCLLIVLSLFAISLSPFISGALFLVGLVILIAGFFV